MFHCISVFATLAAVTANSQRSNDKHFPILSVYLLLLEWTESFNNVYLMCEFLIQSFLSWVEFHVAFFSSANFDWLQGFKIIRYVLSYSTTITLNFLFSIACIRRKWKLSLFVNSKIFENPSITFIEFLLQLWKLFYFLITCYLLHVFDEKETWNARAVLLTYLSFCGCAYSPPLLHFPRLREIADKMRDAFDRRRLFKKKKIVCVEDKLLEDDTLN